MVKTCRKIGTGKGGGLPSSKKWITSWGDLTVYSWQEGDCVDFFTIDANSIMLLLPHFYYKQWFSLRMKVAVYDKKPTVIPSPHMLVLATSEQFLLARGTFRVILASESHWLQPMLVLSVRWWPTPTGVGRVLLSSARRDLRDRAKWEIWRCVGLMWLLFLTLS
jgi:hypothetical protein